MVKIYTDSQDDCPNDATVREGNHGGFYYETETRGDHRDTGGPYNSFDELLDEVTKNQDQIQNKGRIYVDSPDEAPEDANVEEGDQGGYYYDYDDIRDEPDDSTQEALDAIEDGIDSGMSAQEITQSLMEGDEDPEGLVESLVSGFENVMSQINDKSVSKQGRVYVSEPSEAPERVTVHEGQRGGYYYISEPEILDLDPEHDVNEAILELVNMFVNVYGEDGLNDLDYWSSEMMDQLDEGEMIEEPQAEIESIEIGDTGETREAADTVHSVMTTFGREGLERLDYWTNQIQDRRENTDE